MTQLKKNFWLIFLKFVNKIITILKIVPIAVVVEKKINIVIEKKTSNKKFKKLNFLHR